MFFINVYLILFFSFQFCTVRGVTRENILELNGREDSYGKQQYHIMHVKPAPADLKFGDLKYNQFDIKIRNILARKPITCCFYNFILSNYSTVICILFRRAFFSKTVF